MSFTVPPKHRCPMFAQRQTASPPQADQPSAETLLRKDCASRFLSSATAESGLKTVGIFAKSGPVAAFLTDPKTVLKF
jgi:hypothetical protein